MRPVGRIVALALLGPTSAVLGQPAQSGVSERPRVRLLAPGRAPLRALRYRVPVGHKGHISMGMKMAMEMSLGGQPMPTSPTPEIVMRMDYRVTEVSPAGDIRYEAEFGEPDVVADPSVPASVATSIRDAIKAIRGLKGYVLISSQGYTLETRFEVPPGAAPALRQQVDNLRQSLQQISNPFPEEPVGVGAQWETTMRVSQNGVTIDQSARQELVSLDGDKGRVAMAVKQSAKPQRMESPNLPPTARMDLVSLESTGEGENVFDLARLAPTSGKLQLKMQMKSAIQMGSEKAQDMNLKMDMTMTVTGR